MLRHIGSSRIFGLAFGGMLAFPLLAYAAEFTSSNFKIIDPVILLGGGRGTSTSFQVEESIGQPGSGISNSANFQLKGGFLYFPAPTPAPTPATPAAATPPAAGGGPLSPSRIVFPADLLALLPPKIPETCPSGYRPTDLDCDGSVGLTDLSIFLFLSSAALPQRADLNGDATVDASDLSILFTDWSERLVAFAPESTFGRPVPIEGAIPEAQSETAAIGEAVTRAPQEGEPGSGVSREAGYWIGWLIIFLVVGWVLRRLLFGRPGGASGG